jgi:uncharacterized membrane protein YadS
MQCWLTVVSNEHNFSNEIIGMIPEILVPWLPQISEKFGIRIEAKILLRLSTMLWGAGTKGITLRPVSSILGTLVLAVRECTCEETAVDAQPLVTKP